MEPRSLDLYLHQYIRGRRRCDVNEMELIFLQDCAGEGGSLHSPCVPKMSVCKSQSCSSSPHASTESEGVSTAEGFGSDKS
jgi:hypothetical protein